MILYFSGTGNSKFIAEQLGKILEDKVVDLFSYIKEDRKATFKSEKPYVLVSPTYGWRLPRFLSEYLRKAKFEGNKNFYTIMNFGDSSGNSQKYIKEDLLSMGLEYRGVFGIKMPENYLMLFDLASDKTNREIIKKSKGEIKRAANFIKEGRDFPQIETNLVDKLSSFLVNAFFYKFIVKDKKFYYTNNCQKCGLCEKVCVLNNISYVNGYPRWQGKCSHCAACIAKCPYEAIEYGKKTLGKERYLLKKLTDSKE